MTIEALRGMLGWCAVLNMGCLLLWFLLLLLAHGWVHRMHSKWFPMTVERFTAIHYSGMMNFKIAVFFFNVVPYLALRIVD